MEREGSEELVAENGGELVKSVDAFLFDCDGVIWKGDKVIEGVPETLSKLRSKGKRLVFVTNNSTKSRAQYAAKFQSLGIPVSQDEIFSSSFAAAMYLKSVQFPPDKSVYVVGGDGILEELRLAGFTPLGGPQDAPKTVHLQDNRFFHHDPNVGAVVVGLDPYINFYKLQYATLCIRQNPGCLFIATNRDAVGPMTEFQDWPGFLLHSLYSTSSFSSFPFSSLEITLLLLSKCTVGAGCMVAALCGSTQKEPIVVGKPSTFMMDFLLDKFKIDTSRMCMVGDRLDTDILFGQSAGCKTLLVLSGVTTLAELQDSANTIVPDYYTNRVSDLLELLGP